MSFSNFDAADIPNSGLLIPAATVRHDSLDDIIDELLAIAPTVFGEITGAGPTPAALQGYAGNLTPGSSNATTDTVYYQRTLYWKGDSLFSETPAYARLLRGVSCVYGHTLVILDTKPVNNPANDSIKQVFVPLREAVTATHDGETNLMISINDQGPGGSGTPNLPYEFGLTGFATAHPTTSVGNIASLNDDIKFYMWAGADWLCVQCRRVADDLLLGHIFIFIADEPADGSWARADYPTIFALQMTTAAEASPTSDASGLKSRIIAPGGATIGVAFSDNTFHYAETGGVPALKTPSNDEIVQRLAAYMENGGVHRNLGYVPGIRVIRRAAAVSLWDEITVGGTVYICVASHGDWAWLVEAGT